MYELVRRVQWEWRPPSRPGSRSMAREITQQERDYARELLQRARAPRCRRSSTTIRRTVDRLCQAIGWATANEKTFTRIAHQGVDESGLGDREGRPAKRFKIIGILRDALRQKSMGVIEELPEKGIVKYAKPAGVIAVAHPEHESGADAARQRHLCAEVQGRRHLLAASGEQADDLRDGRGHAQDAAQAGRAGGPVPMRRRRPAFRWRRSSCRSAI